MPLLTDYCYFQDALSPNIWVSIRPRVRVNVCQAPKKKTMLTWPKDGRVAFPTQALCVNTT